MPSKPPSDRTPAPGVPPVFNRSLSKFIPARRGSIGSLSAGGPPTTQIHETNPITTRPKCETNPISRTGTACRAPTIRNEPNLSPPNSQSPTAKSCFSRNEPNLPLPQPGPRSKYAKRTQSTPRELTKRTQSWYRWHPPAQTVPPNTRNEPNLPPHAKKNETNPIYVPRRLFYFLHSPFACLAGNSPRPITPCDIST